MISMRQNVYVIDQRDLTSKKFDEHKIMAGFPSREVACDVYDRAFSDGKGRARRMHVTEMTADAFRNWMRAGNVKLPMLYGHVVQ